MKKVEKTEDAFGRGIEKGDTVSAVTGQWTGRVAEIAKEDGETFVKVRPLHQPYSAGTWYAADRVMWVSSSNRRR